MEHVTVLAPGRPAPLRVGAPAQQLRRGSFVTAVAPLWAPRSEHGLTALLSRTMSDGVVAALIGLAGGFLVALLTALYSNGGRGSLQLRVIKQEAEVAALLPENSAERKALTKQVEARTAIYRARLVPRSGNEHALDVKKRWKRLGIVTGPLTLLVTAATLAEYRSGVWWLLMLLYVPGILWVGALGGVAIGAKWRDHRAGKRPRRLSSAKSRLNVHTPFEF
jgi:hypothetical protein